jgi:type IV fimbrial biogenesis protein FimT
MVVVALAGILAALAAPSLRDFIVRNKMTSISNEFTGGLLRARNEAVSKNTCVTMCISTPPASGDTSALPSCDASGDDWQVGWIAFLDPTCANPATPASAVNLLFVRKGESTDYLLKSNSAVRNIEFGARGISGLGNAGRFDLRYKDENTSETRKFGSGICLGALGRARSIPPGTSC